MFLLARRRHFLLSARRLSVRFVTYFPMQNLRIQRAKVRISRRIEQRPLGDLNKCLH